MIFTNFTFFEFESGLRETERSKNRGIDRCYSFLIKKRRLNICTLIPRFYDLSVSQNRKIVKFVKIRALIFFEL